jgi:hypothetical protein
MISFRQTIVAALALACAVSSACSSPPAVEFTRVPEAGPGGPNRTEPVKGRVTGAKPSQRIMFFARSGTWWVQPIASHPFTAIRPDSTWETATHLGTEYAALLVETGYSPPATTNALPALGNGVVAVATTPGKPSATPIEQAPKRIVFSGYDWEVRHLPNDRGGATHSYSTSNAWTDSSGCLHLRMRKVAREWTCAEVSLTRSLGYGTYTLHVQKLPVLEPATAFAISTWDDNESGQNHREMDIELSQWGDPQAKNAQFAIQPYYVAANVFRFIAPFTPLTCSFRWEPGRVTFRAGSGAAEGTGHAFAEHVFTSGVPSPGGETLHLALYQYGKPRIPQQNDMEVVLQKFEFLP